MISGNCVRDLTHHFDDISGWCLNGCGWREDGRSQYWLRRPVPSIRDFSEPRRAVDRGQD